MNDVATTPASPPEPTLAKKTLTRLAEAMEAGKSAAIAQVIQLIQEITTRADTISVDQLADLISRDLATMTKVLSVANTIGYNPTGAEVTTVHQAIQTVGFEKIRNIAMALLLLESAEHGAEAHEKRNVAALALASGTLAQAVLEQRGGADPEQAFVCAALRSYGHLLLVNFMGEDFTRARELAAEQKISPDAACRRVLGLTPLDVGREMLAQSQVAKSLLATLRPVDQDLINSKVQSASEVLLLAAEFSTRFCELTSTHPWEGEELRRQALKLANHYGSGLGMDEATLEVVFERTERRLGSFAKAQGLRSFTSPLMQRLGAGGLATTERPAPRAAAPRDAAFSALLLKFTSGGNGEGITLRNALVGVLDLLHAELNLDQSVVFLKDEILPTWSARVGRGPLYESIRCQPLLSEDTRNVFTICLTRGEDVLIQSPNEPSIRKYIPEWLRSHLKAKPLLLLSLRDAEGTFGVICAVGKDEKSISLTSQLAQPLKDLRKGLATLSRVDVSA
jgi:HD-like signal output (HDOD) protein